MMITVVILVVVVVRYMWRAERCVWPCCRQVKRRKMRLENAVQAARRYKRALEAERRRSNVVKSAAPGDRGVGFFKKIFAKLGPTKTGLFKTAERSPG